MADKADKANTTQFQREFEKIISQDFVMLDNVASFVWKDGEPGCFLLVVSPKSEGVYGEVRDHAVKIIREAAGTLVFKAKAQELVVNGIKSAVFKITPEAVKSRHPA